MVFFFCLSQYFNFSTTLMNVCIFSAIFCAQINAVWRKTKNNDKILFHLSKKFDSSSPILSRCCQVFMVIEPVKQCIGVNSSKFNLIIRPIADITFVAVSAMLAQLTHDCISAYSLLFICASFQQQCHIRIPAQTISFSIIFMTIDVASTRMYRTANQITYIPLNFTKNTQRKKKSLFSQHCEQLLAIRQQQRLAQSVSTTQKISTVFFKRQTLWQIKLSWKCRILHMNCFPFYFICHRI